MAVMRLVLVKTFCKTCQELRRWKIIEIGEIYISSVCKVCGRKEDFVDGKNIRVIDEEAD